jgi:Delta7-sterol 5-desaturase
MIRFLMGAENPNISDGSGLMQMWLFLYGTHLSRYLVFAAAVYMLFYVWRKRKWAHRKIQQRIAKAGMIQHEVLYSVLSIAIFSSFIMMIALCTHYGLTKIYLKISDYGWGYFALSIPLFIFWHDTWFYWTHRMMHHKALYKTIHAIHHKSTNPTPWAAFAFHPIEAVFEVAFVAMVFVIPMHPLALAVVGLHQMAFNVMGHSGYEIFPQGFVQHPVFKWLNTPTHHNQHHQKFTCNYGLYYNFWDRVMGTNHATYETYFNEIATREKVDNDSAPESVSMAKPAYATSQTTV